MVLDTNILIYSAKPGGEHLRQWLDDPGAMVSIVSRIEALGFPGISAAEKAALEGALQSLPEAGLTYASMTQKHRDWVHTQAFAGSRRTL